MIKSGYGIGIDLGCNKIKISRTDLYAKKPYPEIVRDMVGNIKIPSLVRFNQDRKREFGNFVSSKSYICEGGEALSKKCDIEIHGTKYELPQYIIQTMIMKHIDDCLQYAECYDGYADLNKNSDIVIVADNSIVGTDNFYKLLGIKINFPHAKITPISNGNAMIFSYLERYIFHEHIEEDIPTRNVLIFDIGYNKNKGCLFRIKKEKGIIYIKELKYDTDSKITGYMIDKAFVMYMEQRICSEYPGLKLNKNWDGYYKLKQQLSISQNVDFTVDFTVEGEKDITLHVTRKEFESLLNDDIDKLLSEKYNIDEFEIDHIEFIGGCSRIPLFKSCIQNICNKHSKKITIGTMDVDGSIAKGASVYAWLINHPEILKTINYARIVKDDIIIHVPLFEPHKDAKVVLPDSRYRYRTKKITSAGDLIPFNHEFNGTIIACNTFIIEQKDILMTVMMENLNPVSKNISYIFKYNMNDMIEIVRIYDDMNNDINFDINVKNILSDGEALSYNHLIEKYTKIINEISIKENNIDRKENFINFMESYYIDKNKVNKLIRKIAQDQINKKEPWYTGGGYLNHELLDVDGDYSKWQFMSPLKEAYEFYQFCQSYFAEEKKQYINNILNDVESLIQMEKARKIIMNIQKTYA